MAPPLKQWNGIKSIEPMMKLLKLIDSTNNYCDLYAGAYAQEAVWKISDNVEPQISGADSLLMEAGINTNETFDFPRMTFKGNETGISSQYIPDELFASYIEPKFGDARLNKPINFTGSVYAPSAGQFQTSFTWLMKSPNSNSNQLVVNGSNAILTPLQRGVYSLSLNVKIEDSTNPERDINPATTSYAVVPDSKTETFEHTKLTDLFSWKTYGDAMWKLTNSDAQTGTFSVQPGKMGSDQTATLEIGVDLPSDTLLEFGFKMNVNLGGLIFYIDSVANDFMTGYFDWNFRSYHISSGTHTLRWVYENYNTDSTNSPRIWLDNIFFPTNAALFTSVESPENIPITFNLFQNYPNPFNPSTTIKYSIPKASFVTLKVYDILGREVSALVNEQKPAGSYEVKFNASNLSSGVYFYRITATPVGGQAGSFVSTKKFILLK